MIAGRAAATAAVLTALAGRPAWPEGPAAPQAGNPGSSAAAEPPAAGPAISRKGPLKLLLPAPLGAERARADAERLARLFSDGLQRPVSAEVLPGASLGAALASGKGDLAWVSAVQYLDAARASGGRAAPVAKVIRGGLPFYRSVIFARRGERLPTPRDLRGKRLAFVAEGSAAGYLLARQVLLAAGLSEAELKAQGSFLGDHAAVCRAVAEGRADAGATFSNDRAGGAIAGCAESLGPAAAGLRAVAVSDPIPNDAIAVRPGFGAEEFAALRGMLLRLGESPEGRRALAEVFAGDAFVASEDGDFALLREALR